MSWLHYNTWGFTLSQKFGDLWSEMERNREEFPEQFVR